MEPKPESKYERLRKIGIGSYVSNRTSNSFIRASNGSDISVN